MLTRFLRWFLRRFAYVRELEAKVATLEEKIRFEAKISGNMTRYATLMEEHRGVLLDIAAERKSTIETLSKEITSLRGLFDATIAEEVANLRRLFEDKGGGAS